MNCVRLLNRLTSHLLPRRRGKTVCGVFGKETSVSFSAFSCSEINSRHVYQKTFRFANSSVGPNSIYVKRIMTNIPQSTYPDISNNSTSSVQNRLIEKWIFEVNTFGCLDVTFPFDLEISSLDPQEYPEMNRAIITICTTEDSDRNNSSSFAEIYNLKTDLSMDKSKLTVTSGMADGIVLPVKCSIQVPLKFDLTVRNTQPCDVTVGDTECDNININLVKSNCTLNKVKSGKVNVVCKHGNITSESLLQGNIVLKTTGKGDILCKRIQGCDIVCETDAGHVGLEMVYAEKAKFSSCHGNVNIGCLHGEGNVRIDTGNLSVETLDGSLRADVEQGNVDVFVEKHESVHISCNSGNVTLRCTDSTESEMEIVADSLSVDNNINFDHSVSKHQEQKKYSGFLRGTTGGKMFVHTKAGSVNVLLQSWLSSLGLKFGS